MNEPRIKPAKRLLTRKQAADVYSVTVEFLERQPVTELPKIRAGHRTVLYDVDDLEQFFKRRKAS